MAITNERASDEFGRLTPEGVARFREKVGVDWPYTRWTTWNEEATRDGIRHYAYGFGDDNPLWCDPAHAGATRWGGIIAPPGFLEGAGLTPRIPTTPPCPRPPGGRGGGRSGAGGRPPACTVPGGPPHPLLPAGARGRPPLGAP